MPEEWDPAYMMRSLESRGVPELKHMWPPWTYWKHVYPLEPEGKALEPEYSHAYLNQPKTLQQAKLDLASARFLAAYSRGVHFDLKHGKQRERDEERAPKRKLQRKAAQDELNRLRKESKPPHVENPKPPHVEKPKPPHVEKPARPERQPIVHYETGHRSDDKVTVRHKFARKGSYKLNLPVQRANKDLVKDANDYIKKFWLALRPPVQTTRSEELAEILVELFRELGFTDIPDDIFGSSVYNFRAASRFLNDGSSINDKHLPVYFRGPRGVALLKVLGKSVR
jgi:hypothetical protein